MERVRVGDEEVRVDGVVHIMAFKACTSVEQLGFLRPENLVAHGDAPIMHMTDQEAGRDAMCLHPSDLLIMQDRAMLDADTIGGQIDAFG